MPRTPAPAPILRRAASDDADAIRNLVASAYGKYVPLIGRTPMPMLVDYAEAVRDHEVWVLDAGGALAGAIELVPHDDHLWVENVAVAPEQQGTGFSRRLLDMPRMRLDGFTFARLAS